MNVPFTFCNKQPKHQAAPPRALVRRKFTEPGYAHGTDLSLRDLQYADTFGTSRLVAKYQNVRFSLRLVGTFDVWASLALSPVFPFFFSFFLFVMFVHTQHIHVLYSWIHAS
jgi:hypothetical protein